MKIEINRTPGVIAALDYLNIHFSTPVIGRINQFPKAPLLWVKKISPKLYLARECNANDAFKAWKAGRKELRQAINKPSYSTPEQIDKSIQNLTTKEPAWILWYGGDKSPIVGEQTRYEVECRSGARNIWNTNFLRWSHDGSLGDIMAYRILDSDQCEKTKTETAWIPWHGSYKSPIVGKQTKFEVKYRDGVMQIYTQNNPLCWRHNGNFSDIIAYRILD